jgi:hypothetical protein
MKSGLEDLGHQSAIPKMIAPFACIFASASLSSRKHKNLLFRRPVTTVDESG